MKDHSLSELIEKCGDSFRELKKLPNGKWMAIGSKNKENPDLFGEDADIVEAISDSPESTMSILLEKLN